MVRKLIKYDFLSFFRLLFPVQMIVLGIALVNRLIQLFEVRDSGVYNTVFTSSIVLLSIASVVALVMTAILSVVRFYQGLYSSEGYLSHTLPVKPSQHIFAKLIVSLLFVAGTLITIFLAICVATFGEVNIELFKAFGYLVHIAIERIGTHSVLYAVELLIDVILQVSVLLLVFYFCLSVGQLAPKKKILLAFGVLFALYILTQIITTALIIIVTTNPVWFQKLFEAFQKFATENQYLTVHLILLADIIFKFIEGVIFFLISKSIMKNKLNLV